jgi:hypothetical protein
MSAVECTDRREDCAARLGEAAEEEEPVEVKDKDAGDAATAEDENGDSGTVEAALIALLRVSTLILNSQRTLCVK